MKGPKKVHTLDPDKETGSKELVVLNINVRDRILQVTIRESTNIDKLYDRISLIGNFTNYPKKFKKIFFAF